MNPLGSAWFRSDPSDSERIRLDPVGHGKVLRIWGVITEGPLGGGGGISLAFQPAPFGPVPDMFLIETTDGTASF